MALKLKTDDLTEHEVRLAADITAIAREAGVDVVGFGDVREALPEDFRHLPVGVSLGVAHPAVRLVERRSPSLWDEAARRRAQEAVARTVYDHRDHVGQHTLETALSRLADYFRKKGMRYFCCPADVDPMESPFTALMVRRFSHKAAASCAGLGTVGRHGLLNHPEWGPYVSWATILTNAPLAVSLPTQRSDCGDCRACVDVCPSGAISGRSWSREDPMRPLVDVDLCRRSLDDREARTGERICGRCAVECLLTRLG